MKYYPRLKQYKASNLVYDLERDQVYSYEWYVIAKKINNTFIINNYPYSPTTLRHSYKVRNLFENLCIDYILIEAPKGLQDLDASEQFYKDKISA